MVDKVRVFIRAGNGGDGAVHFRRERFIPKGGPDGGNGGRGGSIFFETDPEQNTLREFAFRQKFLAEDGKRGAGQKMTGKSGDDLVVKLPVGTLVSFVDENGEKRVIDFDRRNLRVLMAKGGKGGLGNDHFKSSVNQTPMEAEEGEKGQEFWLDLELKLLADVGLVGLPNVGKSTLLSILSEAKPKIADYEFTTLEPNLGVMRYKGEVVMLADIPGLIEGAASGKGLGDDFLRHVERTRVLVHVLAVANGREKPEELFKAYRVVRGELSEYGQGLEKKKELVVLNKTDLMSSGQIDEVVDYFRLKKVEILPVSGGSLKGIEELKNRILEMLS